MSAQADSDRVSAGTGEFEAIRLGQISEAAAVLLARQDCGTGMSLIPTVANVPAVPSMRHVRVPSLGAEDAFVLQRPRNLSLSRKRPILLTLVNLFIMGTLVVVGFLLKDHWRRDVPPQEQTADRAVELAVSPPPQERESFRAARPDAAPPQLAGQASRAIRGQPLPLGLTLEGKPNGAEIVLSGLAAGMTLSAGKPVGLSDWRLPAVDSILRNAWIVPPDGFVGTAHLVAELRLVDGSIAHRLAIHPEWVAPWTVAAAPQQVKMPPPGAATPAGVPKVDREQTAILVQRGKEFIRNGDLAAARLVLRRAAEANDPEAALALAGTYDPSVLRDLKVYPATGDLEMARTWYQKAKEFGSGEASKRLEAFAAGKR
jgi:hypothetical protein